MFSDTFVGEIAIAGFNFAPRGWAFCNGQLLPISQNTALFSLLGTTYGGNGTSTFALPDLRSRAPIHFGQGPGLSVYSLGESGGGEAVTLTPAQMPSHSHPVNSGTAASSTAAGNYYGSAPNGTNPQYYASTTDGTTMNPGMLTASGGNQAFSLLKPYLALNYCIALLGVFPARN
jgi:microcystin-dependent protein